MLRAARKRPANEADRKHDETQGRTEEYSVGADYFVFDSCPIKGEPHDDQVRSKKTCLIIGDRIGIDCKACGEELGWRDLVQHMKEQGVDEFPGYIFEDEDDAILFENTAVVDADAPEQRKILSPDELKSLL